MRKAGSSGFQKRQECEYTWDGLCEGRLACGKRSRSDSTYVCCDEIYFPFGWTTDVCKGQYQEGDRCPSTIDAGCAGSLECGKHSKSDSTYICCKDSYVPFGWTTDVCGQGAKLGERCPSTHDADCEGDLKCGKRSKSDSTYIYCKDTSLHFWTASEICK